MAKSLYVVTDDTPSNTPNNPSQTPISTYPINPNGTLPASPSAQGVVPGLTSGAGLTHDTLSDTLFMTVKDTGTIQIIDASSMEYKSSFLVPGASNLAGIVMDEQKSLLYTVDYGTDQLYGLQLTRANRTLSLVSGIPSLAKAFDGTQHFPLFAQGLALDTINHRLYVANGNDQIFFYDTSTWKELSQGKLQVVDPTDGAGAHAGCLAIDSERQLLYITNGWAWSSTLFQWDLAAQKGPPPRECVRSKFAHRILVWRPGGGR